MQASIRIMNSVHESCFARGVSFLVCQVLATRLTVRGSGSQPLAPRVGLASVFKVVALSWRPMFPPYIKLLKRRAHS